MQNPVIISNTQEMTYYRNAFRIIHTELILKKPNLTKNKKITAFRFFKLFATEQYQLCN